VTFRRIEGEGLFTRYTVAPEVRVRTLPDGVTHLQLEFPSEPARTGSGDRYRTTRVLFNHVFEYRWIVTDLVYYHTDPGAHAFSLIEIEDSELVARIVDHSKYRSLPEGQRLGGAVPESALRHLRIGFDDHGAYEVVCLEVRIEQGEGVALP
jgi:hypothetical protein